MNIGSYAEKRAGHGLISLQLSKSDLQAFADFSKLVPKAAANAQRRAINKTLGWLRTHIAREVGRKEGIAMRAVRQRLRAYSVKSGSTKGKLWFGLNALEASRTGRARQTAAGVSVGRRRYAGAFYKKVYGGKDDIWIRTASKHFKASDYPDSEVSKASGVSSGWISENDSRFPLAKAKVSIEDAQSSFDTWVRKADARLLEILKQEMNFELQKYLRGNARG
jgi:hypothetical protein